MSCETSKKASVETDIPSSVRNPKQIDVSIKAVQGMRDPTGVFWSEPYTFARSNYFKVVPQPSDLNVGYRQFDTTSDLTWSQPVDTATYFESIPYIFRIETDAQGVKLSGKQWQKCDALDYATKKTSLSYSDYGVPLGHYYRYLVLNVPEVWAKNSGISSDLSHPTDELISRLGGLTSRVLDTTPQVSIYDLEQDTTDTKNVTLKWKYSRVPIDDTSVEFQVMRKTSKDGSWAKLGQPVTADANPKAGTFATVTDESLPNVTARYTYKVQLTVGKYPFESAELTAGLLRGTLLKDFEATKGTHGSTVTLTWRADKAGTDADTYRIGRRLVDSDADFINLTTVNETGAIASYEDINAMPGYYYEYRLEVYSGNVLQNTLYDVGFTQSSGTISGHVAFNSASSTTPVEDVRISLQSSNNDAVTGHSMRVDGASTGMQWQADSTHIAKLFGPDKDFTVQMFVRPDSALSEGAVLAEMPGEGRLVVGKQTADGYEIAISKPQYIPDKWAPPTLPTSTKTIDLSTLKKSYVAQHGETLTGTLNVNYSLSIADGATVYLKDVTTKAANSYYYDWAGITCKGNATIVLIGTNEVNGSYWDAPGIYVPSGKTLTITGEGSLTANGHISAAGIGGGGSSLKLSGNIVIRGGNIIANGGQNAAGIGSGYSGTCGNITIMGGTVIATGDNKASGIGPSDYSSCGDITITKDVTRVTATAGKNATTCIGANGDATCGTVTIADTIYNDGISQNSYTYDKGNGSWIVEFHKDRDGYIIEPAYLTYGPATNTGVKLPLNTYSLLTVSRTGSDLQFQVNDGETKTLSAFKYKYLAPFSMGGADGVDSLHAFKGYLSEVRVWNKVLSDEEKANCYDRVLSGRESDLALYWPMDEGLDRHVFDASYVNNLPNGRHATVGGNIFSSSIRPPKEQLSRYGVTDADGNYAIRNIPYVGDGTSYVITPSKGIHKFEPESKTAFITNQALNGYDFTDKSSFPMRGQVTYLGTDIPVDSVQFKVDGVLKQVTTDSNGEYELSVPIGNHRIEAYKNGHHLTTFPMGSGTYEFKKSETVNFVDSTLVNVTGRINGGYSDYEAPVGFALSKNRLGQATIKLSLGRESQCSFNYTVDDRGVGTYGTTTMPVASATAAISSTAWRGAGKEDADNPNIIDSEGTHYIYIKTDPETGEFSALLPPLKYKVESIRFEGDKGDTIYNDKPVFAQNLPLIDATNTIKESMKCDTLAGSSQKYEYSAKMIRQYRCEPTIHVAQTGRREGVFGERMVIVTNTDNSTDSVEVLTLTPTSFSYRFGHPIFRQSRNYNIGIDVAEHYKNLDTQEEFDEIPEDASVRIVNDASVTSTVFGASGTIGNDQIEMGMPYETMQINVKPDKSGHVDYTFEAGWPNFAEGHLLSMSIAVKVDGRTTIWKAPGNNKTTALDLIVLGSITSGTNFVTQGPSVVDMILRRPPGSASAASLEQKEIKSYVETSITSSGYTKGGGAYISEAPTWKVSVGEVMGIATLTDSKSTIVINQTLVGDYTWNDSQVTGRDTTYTTTTAMSTPSEMQYVNEHDAYEPEGGDTYIGRSTNLLFSKGRLLGIFKTDDGDYEIGDKEGITVGQQFSTTFVFPQAYILNTLIPEWEAIIKSRLTEGYINADHTDSTNCPRVEGKVMYYTKYKPGDEKFGTGNADASVWTSEEIVAASACPSYRMVNGTGNKADDEVQNAINQIKAWRDCIADNEEEKVEALSGGTLIDNFSIGNSTKVSQATSTSYQKTDSRTHSYDYVFTGEIHAGYLFNDAGAYAIFRGNQKDGTSQKNDTITTNQRTVAWTMGDNDYRTALSVDVYESKRAWGPIFITRGGQTANPYEGETQTMFYEPGTKLNEGTMRVEVPQLRVDGAAELTDVPTGTQAQFNLQLSNQSETNDVCTYVLEVKEKSNPNGAILTVDGNILSNGKDGRTIKMKGGETVNKLLVVSQSDKNIIDYDDIVLVLRSEKDITCSSEPVKLHVHFVPSSSPVDLAVDHTVINKAFIDENSGITATMYNLDRQSDDLHGLRLRYRRKGVDTWNVLKQWTTRDSLLTQGYEEMPAGSRIPAKVKFLDDGLYELQAQTFGVYGKEEVTFQSNIIEVTQDTHGPKILGMVSPENGQLTWLNRNNMHLRFNEQLNGNAISQSENIIIEGGMNNVVANPNSSYPDVAVQLNGDSIQTEALYDLADSDYAFDMWFYRQGDGNIISLGTGNNLLSLSTHDGGKLRARVGGKDDVFETDSVLPENKWMYMALSYKRKTADDSQNRISMLYATAETDEPRYIGRNKPANDLGGHGKLSVGGDGMKGMISKLRIWNSDVTAQDLYRDRNKLRAPNTPGLVGYWKMDEAHGTQINDCARSRHMLMQSESWYVNNENLAAHMDGTETSAMKIDITTFQPTKTDNFAYEMWFRGTLTDNKASATLMSVGNTDGGKTAIGFDNGKMILALSNDSITLSSKNYLDGNWHHLALNVRRGTSAIAYMDGEAVKVLPESSVPGISSHYLMVGAEQTTLNAQPSTLNCFKGDVDDIRIWNAAFDGQLIRERMYERMQTGYPGLEGYFPMEDIHRNQQGTVIGEFSLDNFGETDSRLQVVRDSVIVNGTKVPAITRADNAPALKPGSSKLRMANTDYDFTVSADEIYFTFPETTLTLMDGNDFVATVSNIRDEHGNKSVPVSWKFHCDFASLTWNLEEDNLTKPWNEVMEWEMYVANHTGMAQDYEVSGMPSWLTVDKNIGTITGYGGYVHFRLGTDVPVGRHTEYIYLTDHLGISRVLKLILTVTGDVPDWTVDPDLYESNMTLTGQLYINDRICENSDTKIAAFDELGLCRGVTSPKYISTRDAYYVNMVIYGASVTDVSTGSSDLTFKVYDASTGIIHPLVGVTIPNQMSTTNLQYTPDANYGSYDAPAIINAANAIEQKISLAKGWTWMSIYVEPVVDSLKYQLPKDVNILKRFKNMKSQFGFSTVDRDGEIQGELTTLEPGKMYKMQLSTKTDFDLVGLVLDTKNRPQTMHPGYNWIGTLANSVMSVDEAFAELAPEPGDRVKSRSEFAEFSNKGYWEGTLESIVPGEGYIYHSTASEEKTFHYPSGKSGVQQASRRAEANSLCESVALQSSLFTLHSSLSHYTPVSPYLYPDNLNIIAVVKKDGQERDDTEIGAFIDGECRGAIRCNKGHYFLTVMGSSETDSQKHIELRVYVDGQEYVVDDTLPFVSDAAYGTLEEPYTLDIDATAIRTVDIDGDDDDDWWTLQGFKIGRKPQQPGIYIHHGEKVTIKQMK